MKTMNTVLAKFAFLSTAILGFQMNAMFFMLAVLLLNTHHKEVFGW